MKRLAALLALLVLLPVCARAAAPIWRVHGPKGEVVLFGSFHLLAPGLDWRPPALDEALAKADELCFEIPEGEADDPGAVALLRREASLHGGRRLADELPPPLYLRLARDARALGLDPALMEGLKPWAVDLLLTETLAGQAGAQADAGVEHTLAGLAGPKVRRCALETAQSQIALLASLGDRDGAADLGVSLDDVEKGPALFTRMMNAYADGDLGVLKAWALDELKAESPRAYRKLFVARNLVFARAVEARLRRPGLTVVVVGEGHMLGPDGVPAILRRHGHAVDGPAT